MKEIHCTAALVAAAHLELEPGTAPADAWVAHTFAFKRLHMLAFLHLPTQYLILEGPFPKAELRDLRARFRDGLWNALHADGFPTPVIEQLIDMFAAPELAAGEPDPAHAELLAAVQKGLQAYARASGDAFDLDVFAQGIRSSKGPGLAAIPPRDTLASWAESIVVSD